jgi:hypothetical protein
VLPRYGAATLAGIDYARKRRVLAVLGVSVRVDGGARRVGCEPDPEQELTGALGSPRP